MRTTWESSQILDGVLLSLTARAQTVMALHQATQRFLSQSATGTLRKVR